MGQIPKTLVSNLTPSGAFIPRFTLFSGEIVVMNTLEAGMLNVGINLCRRNADMTQHHLNGPEIRSMI